MEIVHVFESHHDLYVEIENQVQLLNDYPLLREFKDLLHLSKHGCPCNSEEHEKGALTIYKNISTLDETAFNKIKILVEASYLMFELDGNLLFEI